MKLFSKGEVKPHNTEELLLCVSLLCSHWHFPLLLFAFFNNHAPQDWNMIHGTNKDESSCLLVRLSVLLVAAWGELWGLMFEFVPADRQRRLDSERVNVAHEHAGLWIFKYSQKLWNCSHVKHHAAVVLSDYCFVVSWQEIIDNIFLIIKKESHNPWTVMCELFLLSSVTMFASRHYDN